MTESLALDLSHQPGPRGEPGRHQPIDTGPSFGTHKVVSSIRKGDYLEVVVRDLRTSSLQRIYLSRFTYLWKDKKGRPQDRLCLRFSAAGTISEVRKVLDEDTTSPSSSQVIPYFRIELALDSLKRTAGYLVIREAVGSDDLSLVRHLAPFHYLANEPSWGRKVFLIAFFHETPDAEGHPVGYLMLASPALLSTPRSRLFGWEDAATRLKNANRVVRIARVVVHPEFRGVGIGIELVKGALAYSRDFWNVQGMKPWLVETVAEMSRFHPVFQKAGMIPYGDTTGGNDVVFTPRSRLVSGRQGQGYYRASIYRIKSNIRTPKPYYWYPLGNHIESLLEDKRLTTSTIGYIQRPLGVVASKVLRLENVSVARFPVTNWAEPHTLFKEMVMSIQKVERSLLRFEKVTEDAFKVYSTILNSSRLDDLISDIPDSEIRRTLRVNLTRIRNQANRTVLGSTVSALTRKRGLHVHHQTDTPKELAVWEEQKSRTRSAVLRLISKLERSLCHSKQNERNRALSVVRLSLIRLAEDLESGPSSNRFEDIRSAFGVCESRLLPALSGVNLDILPGQVVMITGPSGSGKSTLLDVISGSAKPTSGRVLGFDPKDIGTLDLNFDPTKRLIDLVGLDTASAVSILNSVGLTEASVYLRRRDELSHGQRYRAAAALLASSGKRIWLADEFCTFLDPLTTRIVARGIRKVGKNCGATLIVATPDPRRLRPYLAPDITVELRSGRVVSPQLYGIVWGGTLRLKDILTALDSLRKHTPHKVNRRVLSLLIRLGLARVIGTVDQPPAAALTREGRAVISNDRPEDAVALHLYWHDLVLHRVFNEKIRRDRKGHSPRGQPSTRGLGLGSLSWKTAALRREIRARESVADHLAKHSLIQLTDNPTGGT